MMDAGLERALKNGGFQRVPEEKLTCRCSSPIKSPAYDFSGCDVWVRDAAIKDVGAMLGDRPGYRRTISADVFVLNHTPHIYAVQGTLYQMSSTKETPNPLEDIKYWKGLETHNALLKIGEYITKQLPQGDKVFEAEGKRALLYIENKRIFKIAS
jgi:hypothetical protein